MKFRLVYKGKLPPGTRKNLTVCKHEIRKIFHNQLKNFVNSDKVFDFDGRTPPTKRKKYNFVPLVWKKDNCSLDILILRSDIPGNSNFAGDIDNRIKTLLDALKMPNKLEIPPSASPEKNEDPFYCLLEDDSLVSRLSVEMDPLLDLSNNSESISSEVLLIVTVNLEPGLLTKDRHLCL